MIDDTLIKLAGVICWAFVGGISFGGFAYVWLECRRKDELERRWRREIERAAHRTYTEANRGRRDAA
jgi:hypothetical protein